MANSASSKRFSRKSFQIAKVPRTEVRTLKRGICIRVLTQIPINPKGALRSLILVRLTSGVVVTSFVPEAATLLAEGSIVLVREGSVKGHRGLRHVVRRGYSSEQERVHSEEPADLNLAIKTKLRAIEASLDSMEASARRLEQVISSSIERTAS